MIHFANELNPFRTWLQDKSHPCQSQLCSSCGANLRSNTACIGCVGNHTANHSAFVPLTACATVQLCRGRLRPLALLPEMEWNEKAPDSLSALNYELVWLWQAKRYLNQNLNLYNQAETQCVWIIIVIIGSIAKCMRVIFSFLSLAIKANKGGKKNTVLMPVRAQLHGFIYHNLQHHETSLSIFFLFKFHNSIASCGRTHLCRAGYMH